MFATVCPRHSEPQQTSRLSAGLLSSRPGPRPALGDNLFFRKPKCDEPFENLKKRKIKISTNWCKCLPNVMVGNEVKPSPKYIQ